MVLFERLKAGGPIDISDLDLPQDMFHKDNKELVPDGTETMINYDRIYERFNSVDKGNQKFKDWLEEAKGKIFHVTRKNAMNSLVALEEDQNRMEEIETDGVVVNVQAKPWLFDMYSDLLFEYNGNWKLMAEIEDAKEKQSKMEAVENKNI